MKKGGGTTAFLEMINGCPAHAMGFDDIIVPAITHASTMLISTLPRASKQQFGSIVKRCMPDPPQCATSTCICELRYY